MAKNNESESLLGNMIKAGTQINGDIKCTGDIRIDGKLLGSLETEGRLVVGESGRIEGNILCKNADLSGTVKAKINVHELLSLKAACNFEGEISTNQLHIEPGASFTGNCQMGGVVKGIEENERAAQKVS
ncbi:MAG TPA: cell shape determination protein CcmA [Flavobacteriales bacterium]|nr:cell shape determination protein CcmA [Flavobacteriales bacterium]